MQEVLFLFKFLLKVFLHVFKVFVKSFFLFLDLSRFWIRIQFLINSIRIRNTDENSVQIEPLFCQREMPLSISLHLTRSCGRLLNVHHLSSQLHTDILAEHRLVR